MDVPNYNVQKHQKDPTRQKKRHKPVITRLRRAGTASFDDLMRPLSECHVTVTKKPRRKRRRGDGKEHVSV